MPARRFGHPDEFGTTCAFLCSAQRRLSHRAEHRARWRERSGAGLMSRSRH
jgi:hypothetical protein